MQTQTAFIDKLPGQLSGIALKEANGNGKRIHLSLRKLRFEQELESMQLPDDAKSLLQQLVTLREQNHAFRYDIVFIFTHLKKRGSFWEDFNFRSLDELIASLDLPNGRTLGAWEILVRLFDRKTFLLVGDEVLGYMTFNVAKYQDNNDERKRDYEAIFKSYCASYSVFDKTKFYETVNFFVNKKYVFKEEKEYEQASNEQMKSKPSSNEPKGTQFFKRVIEIEPEIKQDISPTLKTDFFVEKRLCSGCRERDEKIEAYERYVDRLVAIIEEKVGKDAVPPRPGILRSMVN